MTKPFGEEDLPAWPSHAAIGAGTYALAVGLTALIGWLADIPRLTDWKNEGISMFPNTAACAVMAGLAMLLIHGARDRSRAVRVLAALVGSVGGLTLLEHALGINLGIDTLLFDRPWGQVAAVAPMRMGPPASLAFLLAGTALLLRTFDGPARRVCAALAAAIVLIGMLSFTGHLYGASQMYMLPKLTGIAMQTASVVLAIGLGLLASVPEYEPIRTLQERSAAGILTRRALPILAALALALGAGQMLLEERGVVDAAFGAALRTVAGLGLLTGLLWWAAAQIRTYDRALKISEAAVRRHADQLSAFLDTAAIGLHRVGPEGTILWANRAELTMLGYSAEEYVGHNIADFHADKHVIADMLTRLHAGEQLSEHRARMVCKDGTLKHVAIDSSVLRENGRFLHTQCFTRDVTAQREAETTQALYTLIVESSDDAIISKDLNGVITSWNRGAERLFGYSPSEAIGQSVTMLIPAGHLDEEPAILARVRRGDRIDHYETVRQHKNGTELDISLTVSPIVDRDGTVVGASKIARDVSERRRSAEQREQLLQIAERTREAAEAANRAKDEFLAMLGHELRNPLSAIRNAISVAVLDEANRDRALEIARRQTDQLARIVEDLLDVARITQGRVRLRKAPVVLADVLQRAADGARALMDERGHSMTLTMPATPIRLEADSARLEQAVANLLTNAAKYTNPGGSVTVTAEQEGGEAIIRVRDNGVGLSPDILDRVFDLFTQADRSLDRAEGGLGIGLTVVRRIVELHAGSIEARSAGLGAGCEFIMRLPALPRTLGDATSTSHDARAAHPVEGHPARVLMVEDQPDAAESLRMILELLGHQVRVVHDGLSALEAARANAPQIMLIDIGLPGMNGYELAQAIRREPALQRLVLVALTGYGRPEDKEQALAAGFDYHLAKPVDLDALGQLVARVGLDPETGRPPTRH